MEDLKKRRKECEKKKIQDETKKVCDGETIDTLIFGSFGLGDLG